MIAKNKRNITRIRNTLVSFFVALLLFSSILLFGYRVVYSDPLQQTNSDIRRIVTIESSNSYHTSHSFAILDFYLSGAYVNVTYKDRWLAIGKPDFGVTGTTFSLLENSSMVVMRWTKAGYYFMLGFDTANIENKIKVSVKWSLDQVRNVTFQVRGDVSWNTASRFVFGEDGIFAWDWNDIRNTDFIVNKADKSFTILNMPVSGFLDPAITLNDGVYWGNPFTPRQEIINLNTATTTASYAFTAQWTKNITQIAVYHRDGTNPPEYNVSLRSVNASKLPGTYLGSAILSAGASDNTWYTLTLNNKVLITNGTMYFVVIVYSSGTVDGTHYGRFSSSGLSTPLAHPRDMTLDSDFIYQAWSSSSYPNARQPQAIGWLVISEDGLSDGGTYDTSGNVATFTHQSFSSELFTPNKDINVSAVQLYKGVTGSAGNVNTFVSALLYNVTGSALLENVTMGALSSQNAEWYSFTFSQTHLLKAGITYRIAAQEGSTDSAVAFFYSSTSTNSTFKYSTFFGENAVLQTTTDSGASWTNVTQSDFVFQFQLAELECGVTTTTTTTTTTETSTTTITNTTTLTITSNSTITVTNTTTTTETSTTTETTTSTITSNTTITSTLTTTLYNSTTYTYTVNTNCTTVTCGGDSGSLVFLLVIPIAVALIFVARKAT